MKKQNNVLGYVVAFVADSDTVAAEFCGMVNAITDWKVLSLTKTYDGYWISIDDGNPELPSLILELGRNSKPSVQVACVIPSNEKVVGEEVIGFENSTRSLIRLILQLPDPEADPKDFPKAA
jgi:hypothetical protein